MNCPVCDSALCRCYHQDVGGVEYCDEYILHCQKCGNIERMDVYSGSPCPYCEKNCNEHPEAPLELRGHVKKYLPLYSFTLGKEDFRIVIRNKEIFIDSVPFNRFPSVELDIPVPYDRTKDSLICEDRNNLSINFNFKNITQMVTKIDVSIAEQKGYINYDDLDWVMPCRIEKKKLLVELDESNKLKIKLE